VPLIDIAEAAFRAGCRWFSLREKDLPAEERWALLTELVVRGRRYGATVMAHEDVGVVEAAGAGGVHLPSTGDPAAVRRRLAHALIGVSTHSAEEAAAQLRAGADYVTLSPIFLTDSKPGYGPALGLDALAAAASMASGPIVALGGVGPENAAACLTAGAHGIAVMGEIMRAAAPEAAVRRLAAAMISK
jgi:thiamine-phosphate pyrophosphorylase